MKTVAIDFDGVIHDYRNGWEGYSVIGGEPVPGIFDEIRRLTEAGYEVVIVTSRALVHEGLNEVIEWLERYGLKHGRHYEYVTAEKIPALAYIDDRAVTFRPGMDLLFVVKHFMPWMNDKPIQSALE